MRDGFSHHNGLSDDGGHYARWVIAQDGVYDPAAATARGLAYRKGKPNIFTLASLAKWKVDRSTGFLKVVKAETKPRKADNSADILAAVSTLLDSLAWEEKRSGTTYHGYERVKSAIARARQLAA